jgi:hypothetical protein
LPLVTLNPQLVVDVSNSGDRIEDVLGQALRLPALDSPREGHLPVLGLNLNTRGVEHAVMSQMLADVLLDPGVASLIALWTAAPVRPGHPASGSRVARAAAAAFPVRTRAAVALDAPVPGSLLPPGVAPANALTTAGALTPVAAGVLLPVALSCVIAFMRVRVMLPRLTILPANPLAFILLAKALIAILRDALIAELSLGAIAIAGKLALAFAAGPTAIIPSILDPGIPAAGSPLVAGIATVTAFVVPVHAAALVMLMVVVCHFDELLSWSAGVAIPRSYCHRAPCLKGRKGCAIETC